MLVNNQIEQKMFKSQQASNTSYSVKDAERSLLLSASLTEEISNMRMGAENKNNPNTISLAEFYDVIIGAGVERVNPLSANEASPIDTTESQNNSELDSINFNEGLDSKFAKLLTAEENKKANDVRKEVYELLAKCFEDGLTKETIDKLDMGLKGSMTRVIGGIYSGEGGCAGKKGKSFSKYLEENMGIELSSEDKEKINALTGELPEIVGFAPSFFPASR